MHPSMMRHNDYRPDVDGLRAIAVLGVMLFHYGIGWLPGGFVGVDVFFVISGYLITSIIRRDIEDDRFSFARFYMRRVRRIVPALLAVMFISMVLGWFLLTPGDYEKLGQSTAFASVGLGNLFFYWNTHYFAQSAHLQPLLHTWSLGVEEQFYLAWPIGLFLVARLRSRRLMIVAIALVLVLGLAISLVEVERNAKAAFYMPYSRAWELALGGIIAFAPVIASKAISSMFSMVGVLAVLAAYVLVRAENFPGVQAVLPCMGAALLVWPRREGWLLAFLARMRPIGLISYSLYLWHWPILVFFRHYASQEPTDLEKAVLAVVTFAFAYFSWKFVEQPFRGQGDRQVPLLVPISANAAAVVFGLFISVNQGFVQRAPAIARDLADLDTMWNWSCADTVKIAGNDYCGFGAKWGEAETRALLWGDSHAEHLAPILGALHPDTAFLLAGPCLPLAGSLVLVDLGGDSRYFDTCRAAQSLHLSTIEAADIDNVILSAAWTSRLTQLVSRTMSAAPEVLLQEGLRDLLGRKELQGRHVSIITDTPWIAPGADPTCSVARTYLLRKDCPQLQISLSTFEAETERVRRLIETAARESRARIIDPSLALCGAGLCRTDFGGISFYRDGDHFRRNLGDDDLRQLGKLLSLDQLRL
nr:acyltransferase [Rhizobium sp. Khangiran2]